MNNHAVIDFDFVAYSCSAIAEKRYIVAIHKQSGREKTFNTQTEFFGRGKEVGGWLGEENKKRKTPFSKEDFEIVQKQEAGELSHALHAAKTQIESAIALSKATSYHGYVGSGDSWRVERSTLLKYKGNRENMLRPLYLDDVKEYVRKKFNAETITHYEVDDICVMDCYNKPDNFIIGLDKDYYGAPVRFYNVDRPDEGIVNCNQFGNLYMKPNGKDVGGVGRMFLYFQTSFSDPVDNYRASCFSDKSIGQIGVYKRLKDCKNDKEALQTVVDIFKELYPEPKEVIGWRGEPIMIDWLYVANEMFDLARLLRTKSEKISFLNVLEKMGVVY